jgi:hypothetical protein
MGKSFRILQFAILISVTAEGLCSTEVARFYRCAGQFARLVPSKSDPLLTAVKTGTMTGVEACIELLEKANLSTENGKISHGDAAGVGGYDSIGVNVLKTFNDFHRTWFPNLNMRIDGGCLGTEDVYDKGAMGYFLTRSLFSSRPFKDVVTSDKMLKAIRHSEFPRTTWPLRRISSGGSQRQLNIVYGPHANPVPWNVQLSELGILVGLEEVAPAPLNYNERPSAAESPSMDVLASHGGGVLGLPPFLIINMGFERYQRPDGGLHVQRRWSRQVVQSLLCRDFPLIRTRDALNYVDKTGSSSLPFRTGISCMGCHASMDPMARVIRNIKLDASKGSCTNNQDGVYVTRSAHPDLAAHPNEDAGWIDYTDKDFWRRPSSGNLLLRSHDGSLINKKVHSLHDLGAAIADTDDLYLCAASRYVRFLTGVNLPLFDKGDPSSPKITDKEKKYYELLNQLARDLKEHQDLKKLISSIISHEIYLAPNSLEKPSND